MKWREWWMYKNKWPKPTWNGIEEEECNEKCDIVLIVTVYKNVSIMLTWNMYLSTYVDEEKQKPEWKKETRYEMIIVKLYWLSLFMNFMCL